MGVPGELPKTKYLRHYQNYFQTGAPLSWENPKQASDLAVFDDGVVSYCNFEDG
jgi:hypothetical protein